MGDQEGLSQIAGNNSEKIELSNIDVPSTPMEIEESKINVSYGKEPSCSSVAPREPKGCLTGEESNRDATMVSSFAPIGY